LAGFKFKMQSLLNIKIQLEDNIKNELGNAVQKLEMEKKKLEQLYSKKDSFIAEYRQGSLGSISVMRLREYSSYISIIDKSIENQIQGVNSEQKSVDKIREKLITAIQERKVLEKLKEKHYIAYAKEQLKQEQRLNDENNSFKHYLKNSNQEGE